MRPTARKENLVVQPSGDELLLYDLDSNQAICLNHTSASIWNKCDGTRSPWEIGNQLKKDFGAEIHEDVIWFALRQLHDKGLLTDTRDGSFDHGNTVSRREVIKQIGLASSVTLPIVASLVAPLSVNAQSCFPIGNGLNQSQPGCPCAMGMDCSAGNGTCIDPDTGMNVGMSGVIGQCDI